MRCRAALLLVAAAGIAAACGDDQASGRLTTRAVATIVLAEPGDAWVSTSGTMALRADGARWLLGTYGADGAVAEHPVQQVSVLEDHRVYELDGPPPALVIDATEYVLDGGVYVGVGCYWCSVPFPEQPVVADLHDGTWKVTLGTATSVVDQPDDWDGRPVDALRTPEGGWVLVARLADTGTALLEGDRRCIVGGRWRAVGIDADGVVLSRLDAERRDYSTVRVDRCR